MENGFIGTSKRSQTSKAENNPQLNNNSGWNVVRVLDVILDDKHPQFKELGGYSSIGTIIFQNQNSPINNSENNFNYASPIFANNKSIPLLNEVVLVYNAVIKGNNVGSKSKYYYLGSLNLWNTPHHNALPNSSKNLNEYIDNEGNVKLKLTSEYYDGEFNEKGDIKPLIQYPGDIVYEGRNGNSVRLGSTYKSKTNNWSESGENGDPILIIRNGVVKDSGASWIPTSENINVDVSSIYVTSSQQIPIRYTDNYSSLPKNPIDPSQYSEPQILVVSDRVLLKANRDGVLVSGNQFVHINSEKYIGLNSNYGITLNSNSVNLGSIDAEEQLILGNKMLSVLSDFTDSLVNLVKLLSKLQDFPGGSAIPSPIGAAVGLLESELKSYKKIFDGNVLLSKTTKTI